ncbi:MAG TPA: hypothetical protein VKY19_07595 [Ktedonosporobacter sp.]|jgi:hypothetical protein|nr:hypothetical protein [Ktedonosporobacter sp.]
MVSRPDWNDIEETLFLRGKDAILQFATEHPTEVCSFFAYAWMPIEGNFSLCFDTFDHALQMAKENEQSAIATRKMMFEQKQAWKYALYYSTQPRIVDYAPGIDLFAYASYVDVSFHGWEEFFNSAQYPKSLDHEDDYLEGNVRLVIWKVLERLIEGDFFSHLRLSLPFRVGYQFYDQELIVLRILNWPQH